MNIKRIIILYKRSAYAIYFQHPGSSFRRKGNIGAAEIKRFRKMHEIHYASLNAVEEAIKEKGISCKRVCRGRRFDIGPHDFMVTVGGDGTFLEAARSIKNQIILGVNSDPSWSVGRFCFANAQTFPSILEALLKGRQNVRQFPRLDLRVAGKRFNVLNDVLFSHRNPPAMSRYSLTVDDIQEEQKSSGDWISTAAGSSGAIKSAGGKKFFPTKKICSIVRASCMQSRANLTSLKAVFWTLLVVFRLNQLCGKDVYLSTDLMFRCRSGSAVL